MSVIVQREEGDGLNTDRSSVAVNCPLSLYALCVKIKALGQMKPAVELVKRKIN